MFKDRGMTSVLARVEGFVAPEFAGECEAGVVDIDNKDFACTSEECGLEREKADHAGADDDDGIVERYGVRETAWTATETASISAACGRACSGQVIGDVSRTVTYSANAPCGGRRGGDADGPRVVAEIDLAAEQKKHLPQKTVESKVTRSPGLESVTLLPTLSMMPAASWPMTMGGRRRPVLPSKPWTSLRRCRRRGCG